MKEIITIALIIISTISFGQEVEKMQGQTRYGKATFYVLKSDMTTKHGKYTIKDHYGNGNASTVVGKNGLIVDGNYSNGKKDGIWIKRHFGPLRNIQSQGKYENDIQVGVWTFYNHNGEIIQKYDFDNHRRIMTTECGSDKQYDIYIEDKYVKSHLDCPPSYIGGYEFLIFEFNEQISDSYRYPKKEGGGTFKINSRVSFLLKKDGTIDKIEFRHSIKNEKLKTFIKNLIHEKQDKWIVAELNGSKISSKMNIPINVNIIY